MTKDPSGEARRTPPVDSVAAARLRVMLDQKLGKETPEAIRSLAEGGSVRDSRSTVRSEGVPPSGRFFTFGYIVAIPLVFLVIATGVLPLVQNVYLGLALAAVGGNLYGGIVYLRSRGDAGRVSQARSIVIRSIVGSFMAAAGQTIHDLVPVEGRLDVAYVGAGLISVAVVIVIGRRRNLWAWSMMGTLVAVLAVFGLANVLAA